MRARTSAVAHLSHPSLVLHDSLLPMQILFTYAMWKGKISRNRYACRYNITLEYLDRPKTSLKTLKVITDKGIPITKYEHLLANWLDALEFKRKM